MATMPRRWELADAPILSGRAVLGGGMELAYECFGDAHDPPVLLVHGLGMQLIEWHEEFCRALAGRQLFVIRFDNRDVGLSTHLPDATYTLSDMAADTIGLCDALGIQRAHLVGVSMGGMIVQTVAAEHPERVRTITSIMSSTGATNVGQPTPEALTVLMAPPPRTRDEAIERRQASAEIICSRAFKVDTAEIATRAGLAFDRAFDPAGVGRQLAAIIASGDRSANLATVTAPALIIHGTDDRLAHVSGGRATAASLPGAELVLYDGMGHDLPRELWPDILARLAAHVQRTRT